MKTQRGRRRSRTQTTTTWMVARRRLNPRRSSGVASGPAYSRSQSPSRKHMTVTVMPKGAWASAPRG